MMLQGKKTYFVAVALAVVVALQNLGYITSEVAESLLLLLGAGGVATMAAKVNRLDKKMILVPFLLLGFSLSAQAQAIPTSKLAFNQQAPTLADAQAYTYKYYPDAATTGVNLANVTCADTATAGTFACEAPFPAFTPGSHSLTLSATNAAGEGPVSESLSFTFVVTPSAPTQLSIKNGI